jgi:hypothetical protein
MLTKLIIDLGSKYLILAVYAIVKNEDQPVLTELVVRDVENKNNNIIGRTLEREFRTICSNHVIDEVIVIPHKSMVTHQSIYLEYLNNESDMKKKLLEQINVPGSPDEYITDWVVQDDNPEEDYQKVFASSIDVGEFKFISEVMKMLGVRSYKIGCPTSNLVTLFPHNDRPYLLMQIGHGGTKLFIVKNGVFEMYRTTRSFTGQHLTNILLTTLGRLSNEELYRLKNNATYTDLENNNAISEILQFLDADVKSLVDAYGTTDTTPVVGFTVIGGPANLDWEVLMEMVDITIPRYFPRLPIANDRVLPNNLRQYVYETACMCSEDDEGINFTTPKDKSIGQMVKLIVTFYEYAKIPLYFVILFLLIECGTNYLQNYFLEEKVTEQTNFVNNYQSEVDSLKTSVDELQNTYNGLLSDKELSIVNYGEVLDNLSQLIPQGSFLTNITDITDQYIKSVTDSAADGVVIGSQSVNGLELSTTDMLVALELQGYTVQRVKAFDYALLLKNFYQDAVVTDVVMDGDIHQFTIHVIINK